jgi:hypothetical protein
MPGKAALMAALLFSGVPMTAAFSTVCRHFFSGHIEQSR